jgi:hypothetical protein
MAETGGTAPTLVVGHSRDPSSDFALAAAVDLARRMGGRLHVVHVGTSSRPKGARSQPGLDLREDTCLRAP